MSESASWRPRPGHTALIVVDLQEKLLPVMRGGEEVVARIEAMIAGAAALGVRVFVTEQNPRGLGGTLPAIARTLDERPREKRSFSCFGAEGLVDDLIDAEIDTLVLAGIETHICVQATALDALERGYRVLVAQDAVTTRLASTHPAGLARMAEAGARTTSAEGFMFELMRDCDDPAFRDVLGVVRGFSG